MHKWAKYHHCTHNRRVGQLASRRQSGNYGQGPINALLGEVPITEIHISDYPTNRELSGTSNYLFAAVV